jgi:hypothetical protein
MIPRAETVKLPSLWKLWIEKHLEHAPRAQDRGKGEQLGAAALLWKWDNITALQPESLPGLHQTHIQVKPGRGFGGRELGIVSPRARPIRTEA